MKVLPNALALGDLDRADPFMGPLIPYLVSLESSEIYLVGGKEGS